MSATGDAGWRDALAELRARTARGDDGARRSVSAPRARHGLEAIARAVNGEREESAARSGLLERLAALGPRRVLELGSSGGRRVEALLRASRGREIAVVSLDADAASAAEALRRLEAFEPGPGAQPEVHLYHATIGDPACGAPHLTRVPTLVEALRESDFDLALVDPSGAGVDPYLALAQLLPLLRRDGPLLFESGGAEGPACAAAERLAAELGAEAVLARPTDGGPSVVVMRALCQSHTHEETPDLVEEIAAADPELGRARAAGAHEAVVRALRGWLARRLAWASQDLLLPLGALPPPLNVADVVERCAIGLGGVWSYGAAVTLAMLYRAAGYPSTIYQFGVAGAFAHMVTLVCLPDERILVQDAMVDAEPLVSGRSLTWQEAIGRAVERRTDGVRYAADRVWARAHLYSRASLTGCVARGELTGGDAALLERDMAEAKRIGAEPRALLEQGWSTSLEGLARFATDPARLRAALGEIGASHPFALFSRPCGPQPLSGAPAMDRQIEALYTGATGRAVCAPSGPAHAGA